LTHHSDRHKQRIFLSLFIAVFLTSVSSWAGTKQRSKSTSKPTPKHTPKPAPTQDESDDAEGDEFISGDILNISTMDDDQGQSDNRTPGDTQIQMEVRANDGSVYSVITTPNTPVSPKGTRLKWGMRIKVVGHKMGTMFIALKIRVLSDNE
jgi:hypothetical protein